MLYGLRILCGCSFQQWKQRSGRRPAYTSAVNLLSPSPVYQPAAGLARAFQRRCDKPELPGQRATPPSIVGLLPSPVPNKSATCSTVPGPMKAVRWPPSEGGMSLGSRAAQLVARCREGFFSLLPSKDKPAMQGSEKGLGFRV